MKKAFCLSILFMGIISLAHAQVSKGDILLGGNLGYEKQDQTSQVNSNGTLISPSIGKAIKDNLVAGLNFQYYHSRNSSSNDSYSTFDVYGVEAFVRKYRPVGKGFALFLEGGLGYTLDKGHSVSTGSYTSNNDYHYVNAGFSPGITYAINKRLLLETGLRHVLHMSYSHVTQVQHDQTNNQDTNSSSDGFAISTSLQNAFNSMTIGVRFII